MVDRDGSRRPNRNHRTGDNVRPAALTIKAKSIGFLRIQPTALSAFSITDESVGPVPVLAWEAGTKPFLAERDGSPPCSP
jgi:hypothetical protein